MKSMFRNFCCLFLVSQVMATVSNAAGDVGNAWIQNIVLHGSGEVRITVYRYSSYPEDPRAADIPSACKTNDYKLYIDANHPHIGRMYERLEKWLETVRADTSVANRLHVLSGITLNVSDQCNAKGMAEVRRLEDWLNPGT